MIIISAPHFYAAVVLDAESGRVVRAAPIVNYMVGWSAGKVAGYCAKKGWDIVA